MSTKRVTAFVGTAHRRHTYEAATQFLGNLQAMGDVDTEIVCLGDYQLQTCRGCKACFLKGEEHCPLKDDRDALIAKMVASDGVVFASPVYSFQVSAIMKVFLDRLGFVFHRPQYFGKTFTSIVTQGIYGGAKTVEYLNFVGFGLGFNTVKGCCVNTLDPMTEKQQRKLDQALAAASRRYFAQMEKPANAAPSWLRLLLFRMSRTKIKAELDDKSRDYTHYAEKGWFESDYYYPTDLGLLKQGAGALFDSVSAGMSRNR